MLAIPLYEYNLEYWFWKCKYIFTLKTVLLLAVQMLSRLHTLHKHNIIHRDLKPENFLTKRNSMTIIMIDFGLSQKYIGKDGKHIKFKEKVGLVGTARYMSVNSHKGHEQSRKDDLESLGYIIMYFLTGHLPWMNFEEHDRKKKYEMIAEMKETMSSKI